MNYIYAKTFIQFLKTSDLIVEKIINHGYFRVVNGAGEILFYPLVVEKNYHGIGLTPGYEQSILQLDKDAFNGRILLVAVAFNAGGAHIILEDDSHYMTLTGNLEEDARIYCLRVAKAIVNVTGPAIQTGLSIHDHITQLAD
jgi:hypothetical protein